MANLHRESLKKILQSQVGSAIDEGLSTGGKISTKQLDELQNLARLIEASEALEPIPRRKHWPLVAALLGSLAIVSILLFARVSETEIELDLALAEASFELSSEQILSPSMELVTLGITGLREIRVPRFTGHAAKSITATDGAGSSIRLSIIPGNGGQDAISLAGLILPAGARVGINIAAGSNEYRLSLQGAAHNLKANLMGHVWIWISGSPVTEFNSPVPKAIVMQPKSDAVHLDIKFDQNSPEMFSSQLEVQGLDLIAVEEAIVNGRTLVREVSTVLAGSIYFKALNGRELQLRRGEVLRFEDSCGRMRTLQPDGEQIIFRFHGRVRGMSTGSIKSRRSLMPTYLDWLTARHSLSLLWGTTIYLFGLMAGILRWWKQGA